jgi:hypothetical protein
VSKWIIDDNIEADTLATNTQRAMMVKLSPHVLRRHVVYPLQKKPLANKDFPDDIAYAILTADILHYINLNGATICSADVTSSVAGFIRNGTFMTGSAPNGVAQTPPVIPGNY